MTPETIDAMVAAGATAEVIAAAWKGEIAANAAFVAAEAGRVAREEQAAEEQRERETLRKREQRAKKRSDVDCPTDKTGQTHLSQPVPRDNAGQRGTNPSPLVPPKVSPEPPSKNPPISPNPVGRGSRLPPDFVVPTEWLEWARTEMKWPKPDVREEAAKFVDHWKAKAGSAGVKLDWLATWRNWCRGSRRSARAMPEIPI